MIKSTQLLMMLLIGVLVVIPVVTLAGTGEGSSSVEISGVFGLRPVEAQSSVAIWVPIPEGGIITMVI